MSWTAMWTARFENIPMNDDFGSSISGSIRNIKQMLHERYFRGHELTAAAATFTIHSYKQPIVQIQDADTIANPPASNSRAGALQYNEDTHLLYYDDGAALQTLAGLDHGRFTLNADATTAHTQYILVGSTSVIGPLTVPYVKGLDITTATSYHVMARVFHAATAGAGGCEHDDNVITSGYAPVYCPKAAASFASTTIVGTVDAGSVVAVTLLRRGFMPSAVVDPAAYRAFIYPHFVSGSFPAVSYVPVVSIYTIATASYTITQESLV